MAHSSSKVYVKNNIGLGTAAPLEMLHIYNSGVFDVKGLIEVSTATKSPQFKFKSPTATHILGQETSSSGVAFTGSTPNALCIYTGGTQSLHLGTNNTSRLEITSSGNISVSGSFTTNGVTVGSAANTISGLSTIINTGTLTLPTTTDTLVGRVTSDSLANKTISLSTNTFSSFTAGSILFVNSTTIAQDNSKLFWDNSAKRLGVGTPTPGYSIDASTGSIYANSVIVGSAANTISGLATIINTGTLSLPTSTDTLVGRATSDTLTNKSMSGASNTFSSIADVSLAISYLKADGTRPLTGSWNAGAFSGTFNSVAVGSAANTISGLNYITGIKNLTWTSQALSPTSGAINWNTDSGSIASLTLTGAATISLSNMKAGSTYVLTLTQGGAGSNTVTWTSVLWPAATPPLLSTTVGAKDIITIYYDGTYLIGSCLRGVA